jgi:hypothetical protein
VGVLVFLSAFASPYHEVARRTPTRGHPAALHPPVSLHSGACRAATTPPASFSFHYSIRLAKIIKERDEDARKRPHPTSAPPPSLQ